MKAILCCVNTHSSSFMLIWCICICSFLLNVSMFSPPFPWFLSVRWVASSEFLPQLPLDWFPVWVGIWGMLALQPLQIVWFLSPNLSHVSNCGDTSYAYSSMVSSLQRSTHLFLLAQPFLSLEPVPKFLYLNLISSSFDDLTECEDILNIPVSNENIISLLRTGFCPSVFIESLTEPLWIKGLNNLSAAVARYLMYITPDECGLRLGATTLQYVLVLKYLMLAVMGRPWSVCKTEWQCSISIILHVKFLFSARHNWCVLHFYVAF